VNFNELISNILTQIIMIIIMRMTMCLVQCRFVSSNNLQRKIQVLYGIRKKNNRQFLGSAEMNNQWILEHIRCWPTGLLARHKK